MLLEWFVSFVLGLVNALLDLLPQADPMTMGDLSPAIGLMMTLDSGLPVTETLAAGAAVLSVYGLLFVFGLLRQVWRFVPFIGGG